MEPVPGQEPEQKLNKTIEYRLVESFVGPTIAMIDAYRTDLIGDNDETALIADETKADLRLNLQRLSELRDLILKWKNNPNKLQLVSSLDSIDQLGARISLAIQEVTGDINLPRTQEDARLQLRISIDTHGSDGGSYEDELINQAYQTHRPDLAGSRKSSYMNLDSLIDHATRRSREKARITFAWERVYQDTNGIHPIKGPGIRFVNIGKRVSAYGVHFVGTKPHVTESDLGLGAGVSVSEFSILEGLVGESAVATALKNRVSTVKSRNRKQSAS